MVELYVKSRRLGRSVALLLVLGVIAWVWGKYQLNLPSLRSSETVLVPVILVVPVACAVVVGLSTRSWMGDLERAAPRRLAPWRFAHAVVLLFIAVALLAPAMDSGYAAYGSAAALRNILGYAGLAFLCAAVVGGELSWMLPLAYALPLPLLGVDAYGDPEAWAWSLQPVSSASSWVWALALIVAGVGAFSVLSPRTVVVPNDDE